MNLRGRMVAAFDWAAYLTGASILVAKRRRAARILMIHGVGGGGHPLAAFIENMTLLARHFDVRPLGELVERAGRDGSDLRRCVALTFDDGLKQVHRDAVPVLERLSLPATFFVCPGLVGGKAWLWNQEARERFRSLDEAGRARLARDLGAAETRLEPFVTWMKSLAPVPRKEAEARLRDATPGFVPSPEQRDAYDLVDWDDLHGLSPSLFTIGSHSSTHAILTHLDDAQLDEEILGSRAALEARLARPTDLFCYPNGSHDDRVVRCARRGYRAAVTTDPGFLTSGCDPLRIPRIPLSLPNARFARTLCQDPSSRAAQ